MDYIQINNGILYNITSLFQLFDKLMVSDMLKSCESGLEWAI